ncbi:MAG: hypothetical protein J0H74_07410 [Chitinophagaceae bacterium]|nr:hypothetical protein [Chitinophagaceae bacterium]
MKKFLAFILAIVYLFAAIPATCSFDSCEGDCDGVKHIKTEDHHGVSAGVFKLDPLSPATVAGGQYLAQERVTEVLYHSSLSTSVFGGDIPLFVRNCNFRI